MTKQMNVTETMNYFMNLGQIEHEIKKYEVLLNETRLERDEMYLNWNDDDEEDLISNYFKVLITIDMLEDRVHALKLIKEGLDLWESWSDWEIESC